MKMPKTNSIALLIWQLAARGEPPADRYLKQWQWPLDVHGVWRQEVFRQAVTEQHNSYLALGTWR